MTQKEFLNYEQALALKELGFDEECLWFTGKEILAPLYQQAFRWFREKYNIVAYIEIFQGEVYDYTLTADEFGIEDFEDGYFNTYQEAELACLKKLIEIIKEKK